MPIATVSTDYGEAIQLKSLQGAFVRLRPLTYGMRLERLDKASKLYMEMTDESVRPSSRNNKPEKEAIKAFIESMNTWAREFDFSYCIGEHNLQDANGQLLDFSNSMTIQVLDPRVGAEIARLLDELNGEEEEETLDDFLQRHSKSSADAPTDSTPAETVKES